MSVALRFSPTSGLVVLRNTTAVGYLPDEAAPAPGGTSTFTITSGPTNPYIGEVTYWSIEGSGGHTVDNNLKDIWVETDVGEAGATYSFVGTSAETARGRVSGHAYSTAGLKTRTVSSWVFNGSTLTQEFTTTVVDPDSESWNKIYWVDLTGSTTGMPPDDGTNLRVTSEAQWRTLRTTSSPGQKIRVRFRGNTNHTFTINETWRQAADVVYVDSFGTGKATLLNGTAEPVAGLTTVGAFDLFSPTGTATTPRWIFNGLKGSGGYNAVSGRFGGDNMALFTTAGIVGCEYSFWRCEANGLGDLGGGSGANSINKLYRPRYQDNFVTNWYNYGLGFTGASDVVVIRGNDVRQVEGAGHGDAKQDFVAQPNFPEHGPGRISRFRRLGISDNLTRSMNGWTSSGYQFNEYATQPDWRIYMDQNEEGTFGCVINNTCSSRLMFQWGHASTSDTIVNNGSELLAVGNTHDFHRQGAFAMQAHTGGLYAYSNLFYRPDLDSARTNENCAILDINAFFGGTFNTTTAAWQKPSYVGFNTYFSDATASNTHGASQIELVTVTGDSTPSAPVYTTEHNQLSGDGHTGTGYVAAAGFSRGDDFRPITGAAAESVVASGPPVDFNLNKRTSNTNKGAHHSTAANVAVSSPTHTGDVPTIAANYDAGSYGLSSIGTGWNNVDNLGMFEYHWQVGGVDSPTALQSLVPTYVSGGSGNLTLTVTMTNRSGNKVSATSSPIAL